MDITRVAQGTSTTLGVLAAAALARRAWRSPPVYLARMSGTSISAPDAVGWVTDFLNAAYYARRPELRDVEDLRVAFAILTTRWHRLGHRRLHAPDMLAFHRAFFRERILDAAHTPRGRLDREQLDRVGAVPLDRVGAVPLAGGGACRGGLRCGHEWDPFES